jgi:hypothetical protein
MRTEIEDLLADAADDSAQPLHHSIDDIIRRGRRGTRLRQAGTITASALTVGAIVGVFTLWPSGGAHPNGGTVQPAGPAATTSSTPSSPGSTRSSPVARTPGATLTMDAETGQLLQPPASKLTDAQIIARCKQADDDFLSSTSNKVGGGTDKIDNWKVRITQGQDTWFRAILQSPDGKRIARCQVRFGGSGAPGGYYDRNAVVPTPPFKVWTDGDGSWGQIPQNVARVTFQVADGPLMEATVTKGFYVLYAYLPYVDVKGKPIWATFYDAQGKELARFDSNEYNPEDGSKADREPIFPK